MWLRKIIMRKTQFFIIVLLTMMAAAILTACISFTIETQQFVEAYYSADQSPVVFSISSREDAKELLLEDEEAKKVISKVVEGKAKYVTDSFYVNEEKIANEGSFFYEVSDVNEIGYPVTISSGKEQKAPKDDELWISNVYAKAYDIKVDDIVRLGKNDKEYKVSAIVNTAICSSGFIDCYPFYVSEQTLEDLEGIVGYEMNIFSDDEDLSLKELQEFLPKEYVDSEIFWKNRSTLKMCISILTGIFGGVGVVASIIILIVSIVVFRYLVRATIEKEFQMIGTYKALGRDNKEIKRIYLLAYTVSGVVGMIPGVLLARPLAVYLGQTILGGNKAFELTGITTGIEIAVVVFMCALLMLNVYSELKKVHSISPIQAMNLQMLSSKEKLNKSIIPSAHSSLQMAINGIWKRKGTSFLIILILTVSIYMDVMASEVALTLSNYSEDKRIWENLPAYDCMIKTMGNEEALTYIRNSEDVEDYVQVMLEPDCSGMQIEGTDWSGEEANPMIYSDFNEERYADVPFTKGRICLEEREITASESFLKGVGKEVGDYIKISNGDKEITCLIIGSYSAMMKGGVSFYMNENDYRALGYSVDYETILVFFKEGVDYDSFAENFETSVEKSLVFEDFVFIEREGDTVGEIAYPICAVLFAAFAAFSILNIVNLIHTQTKENRRKYGILKAMGFTTGYICRENIASLTIQYGVAIIITIIINELLSPFFFSLACGVYYINKPIWLIATVVGVMYILILLITFIMLGTIRKIKPVELMEE